MANLSLAHLAQPEPVTWIQRLSRSERVLVASRQEDPVGGLLGTSVDSFTVATGKETGAVRNRRQMGWTHLFPGSNQQALGASKSHLCLKKLFKGCQKSKGSMHSLGNYQRLPEG